MFNKNKFKEMLAEYKANFETTFQKEKFKWEAIKYFQDNWNIDAPNFAEMLNKSLDKTGSLLTSRKKHGFAILSKDMIVDLAKFDPEKVRKMFIDLYDESKKNVGKRIADFSKEAKKLTERFRQEKDSKANNPFQSLGAISTYLWLMFPDKYYIYKNEIACTLAENLNPKYNFDKGKIQDKYALFLRLNNEIKKRIEKDNGLLKTLKENLTEECYEDPKCITLTIDFGYYFNKNTKSNQAVITPSQNVSVEKKDSSTIKFWWLNASRKKWNVFDMKVGNSITYTFRDEKGRKRRISENFEKAKIKDWVVVYATSPDLKIAAIGYIDKINDNKDISIKKFLDVPVGISYSEIKETESLQNMEFIIKKQQGALFKLTKDEFNVLITMIKSKNQNINEQVIYQFSPEKALSVSDFDYAGLYNPEFLENVFLNEDEKTLLKDLVYDSKNVILQGPPGVGKTFVAKKLAYSIIGKEDDSRIMTLQFHQSYSYEDFVEGYRPCENGFVLEEGPFKKICEIARADEKTPCFLIIDEINRGYMSKIFGELFMLIEKDKRGKEVNLMYSKKPFSVPSNLFIIGTMNTADRSLALLDYALRRRFAFYDLKPAFEYEGFKNYIDSINNNKLKDIKDTIIALNVKIKDDKDHLGEGYCIGHSYFCDLNPTTVESKLKMIVKFEIIPLLKEYWFEDPKKVEDWSKKLNDIIK